MTRRSRSTDSPLLDIAREYRDIPLVYAVVTSGLVLLVCEVGVPIWAHSSKPSGLVNWPLLAMPFFQVLGWLLGGAILIYGVYGFALRLFHQRTDRRRFDEQSGVESLRRLSWQEFERLLGEFYRRQGYEVTLRGGPGADGGADLELHKGDEKLLVQAKHWKTWLVGLPQVRELWGAVADEHADGAILITSGKFTEDARAWTHGKNLTLIDGSELAQMIASIQQAESTQPHAAASANPTCPSCGRPMVQRVAKKGQFAGQAFWGCTGYPECRHTEPITPASGSL
jgi:restriction system protein